MMSVPSVLAPTWKVMVPVGAVEERGPLNLVPEISAVDFRLS
jgi:hypothetical protein